MMVVFEVELGYKLDENISVLLGEIYVIVLIVCLFL